MPGCPLWPVGPCWPGAPEIPGTPGAPTDPEGPLSPEGPRSPGCEVNGSLNKCIQISFHKKKIQILLTLQESII